MSVLYALVCVCAGNSNATASPDTSSARSFVFVFVFVFVFHAVVGVDTFTSSDENPQCTETKDVLTPPAVRDWTAGLLAAVRTACRY